MTKKTVESREVEFLFEPNEFYSRVLQLIQIAQKRVAIATLYFGDSSDSERRLIAELGNCAKRNVEVDILLDGPRNTRRNCRILPLLRQLAPRAKIHSYYSPFYKCFLPDRIRESLGTQHMKLVIADDTVLITGANMSEIYFKNRQDRYCIVKRAPGLANSIIDQIFHKSSSAISTKSTPQLDKNPVDIDFLITNGGERDEVTESLLNSLAKDPHDQVVVTLSTPYLNPTPEVLNALLSINRVNIITNSLESNAFYNSRGLSKHVPLAYEIILRDLLHATRKSNNIRFLQYNRAAWSFHPKGIWVERNGKIDTTIVGSSNFGYRSHYRDLEISFKLSSECTVFQSQLKRELTENILNFCSPIVSSQQLSKRSPPWLAYLVRGPLKTLL